MDDVLAGLSPRMRALLDAAVVVTSTGGLRGLTHRAVDTQAGLPQGTCSAYLRTRSALHTALAQYVAARLAADIAALSVELATCAGDPDRAAARVTSMFVAWLRDHDLVVARLELSLEAIREPDLAETFRAWRAQLVEVVGAVIEESRDEPLDPGARAAISDHAEATVAALEGVLLAALLRPARTRRAYVSTTVSTLLGALSAHQS